MAPSSRDKLIELVGEAMSRPMAEREAWVRAACPDPATLREVQSLLEAAQGAGAFLDRPTLAQGRPAAAAVNGEAPGGTIGRYRLLELIGEGGFGRVFMAEQREPVLRRVAVKVIKAGMDTAQVVARFEAERQALAMMDHPGIATVLDGGATESGRPYFVMELVKGVPITAFCDGAHMPISDRLGLFRDVCGAVQHAHQKGVIHRDLKPGNVLVADSDGRPQPKIIDFGIAKATSGRLTDRTLFTEFRQMIGTPEYMSPEQALGAAGGAYGGADVDTRSDIYSLGVLLYELLTGTTPLDRESLRSVNLADMQRMIGESQTPRPSTRFSAIGTRSEVAAHRRIEPGRLGTLLRGDLDWIVLKALEKDRSRRYDTVAALAEDVRRFTDHEPVSATPPSAAYRVRKFVRRNRGAVAAGSMVVGALVVGLGAALWQAGVAARERDAAREAEADTRSVAEFQASQLRGLDAHVMGTHLREDLVASAAEAMRRAGGGADPASIDARVAALEESLSAANLTDVALRTLERNVFDRAIRAAGGRFADQPDVQAGLLASIGEIMIDLGLFGGAADAMSEAVAIRRREFGDDDQRTIWAVCLLGAVRMSQARVGEADPMLRDAMDRSRRVLGPDHPVAIDALTNFGLLRRLQNRMREAEACFVEGVERNRRVRGPLHVSTLKALSNLATVLHALGKAEEAEPFSREVFDGFRAALGDDDPLTLTAATIHANTLRFLGRNAEAEPLVREALAKRRRVLGDDHPGTLRSMTALGDLLLYEIEQGDASESLVAEAESLLREVLDRRRRRYGAAVEGGETLKSVHALGKLLVDTGRPAEAEPFLREAVTGHERAFGVGSPFAVMSRIELGRTLAGTSKFAEAEAIFLPIAAGSGHGGADLCAENLAELYEAWDRAEPGRGYAAKAAEWRAKASAPDAGK